MRWMVLLGLVSGVAMAVSCGGDEFQNKGSTGGSGATGGSVGGSGGDVTGGGGTGGGTGGAGGSVVCVDEDGDGVTDCAGDCDDDDANVYPGAPEICGDGLDNGCGNDPDPAATCQGIGTYVSALIGDDANPGTMALPVLTINEGMNKAVQLGMIQPVYVAEGTYPEDVILVEGVDLWGGHQCASQADCTWARDPSTYVSTIEDQDADGIYAGHNISSATEVIGFTVLGLGGSPGNGNNYAAFTIQGTPVIYGNHIVGGDINGCNQCRTQGIWVTGAPVAAERTIIAANLIEGGASTATTLGIEVANGGTADIDGNEILGGQGNWTRCISMPGTAGEVSITNNDLHAGSCNGNNTTFAIYAGQGIAPVIDRNRVNADPNKLGNCPGFNGSWWTGGIESEGSQAVVTNNVVFGVPSPRSAAILLADCEGSCQLGQAVVVNNTLDGHGSPGNTTISAAIVFKTWKSGQNVVVGRVRNNILLGGQGNQAFSGYEDVNSNGGPVVGSTAQPQEFDNNDLFGTTTMYLHWDGNQAVTFNDIPSVDGGVNGANDNLDGDPMLDASGHLQIGSACIDAGTQSGGETPTWDIDNDTRPQGAEVDVGADEAG